MEPIEVRRARRLNRLWEIHRAEGKQAPEPGTTAIKMTRAGRRYQRAFVLSTIRSDLARIPPEHRPIIRRERDDLVLDYGIYQTRQNLRSFRIEYCGDGIGGIMRHAEALASKFKNSLLPMEADAAKSCLRCVEHLRKVLTDVDVLGEARVVSNSFTQHDAIILLQLGRLMEQLESALPGQRLAVKAQRSRVGARKIAEHRKRKHSKIRTDRQAAVAAEIERQRQAGQPLNYGDACQAVAQDKGCDVKSIKNSVPNLWTPRPRRKGKLRG